MRLRQKLKLVSGRILSDSEEAEDVLQDSFVRLWKRKYMLQSEKEAEALLSRTVRNASLNERRRQHTVPLKTDLADDSPEWEEKEKAYAEMHRKMETELSGIQRYILEERDLAGFVARVDDPDFDGVRGVFGYLSIGRRKKISKVRTMRIYCFAAIAASLVALVGTVLTFSRKEPVRNDNWCVSYAYGEQTTDSELIMASVESSLADFFAGDTPAEVKLTEMFKR